MKSGYWLAAWPGSLDPLDHGLGDLVGDRLEDLFTSSWFVLDVAARCRHFHADILDGALLLGHRQDLRGLSRRSGEHPICREGGLAHVDVAGTALAAPALG